MNRLIATALVAACALAGPALAGSHSNGKGKGNGKAVGQAAAGCPPGLAKKNPPCVPPGQAKQAARSEYDGVPDYTVGDIVDEIILRDRLRRISDYDRYNLRDVDGVRYYRDDRQIYRVDPTTRAILDIIALAEVLN
ncbi:hypothetical protein [Palleronia pelagia]|uniref:Regulator RcnB of Ni and Co efflux n=1 Tax=Palleronia pelagia TaxID=387096 RepID=A0A1H8ICS8_9RHOB|nr:hypothetical protein [Palleronia pelagia]SEN66244.1 hypothetical protein SAMN04488011_105186 [Palleronia pelagia]